MVARDVPTIDRSDARRCRARCPGLRRPSNAPAVSDRVALLRCATPLRARWRPRPDAESVFGGEVSSSPPRAGPGDVRASPSNPMHAVGMPADGTLGTHYDESEVGTLGRAA